MSEEQSYGFRERIWPLREQMFRLAHRITLSREEAEDVVQDSLERLWRERARLPLLKNVEAWSLRLVHNLSIDRLRRAGRQSLSLEPERDTPMAEGADHTLEMQERMAQVRAAMDRLPQVQRSIMHLRDIEGKSYAEIAEILELTESQVKVYLHRGREKVKKSLVGV